MSEVLTALLLIAMPGLAAAQDLTGRWKLLAAEDLRADGTVARRPWGAHPVGTIVVEGGFCYVQIMSSDIPTFVAGGTPVGEQMKAALLSSYIAYSGPCVVDESKGSVTLTVEAAWRPDYVGTTQVRYFRFENGRLLFGPAPGSIRTGEERWTRRLTLERAAPAPR
jgi:hypothetical protein